MYDEKRLEYTSGVSWGAVLAGAAVAAALSLILLSLGTGLGLSAMSPWNYAGASGEAMGIASIAWLLLMAAGSSALGGYIAGRARPRWSGYPSDESFFLDTAHGLLAWCVATLASAALLTSAATGIVGAATKAAGATAAVAATATAAAGAGAAGAATNDGSTDYFTDMLFRGSARTPEGAAGAGAMRQEATAILANALRQGNVSDGDRAYLAQLVSQRTGLTPAEAEQRVTQVTTAARTAADAAVAKAKAVADEARRLTVHLSLWIFISLLLGAFSAAWAASIGGRQRMAIDPEPALRRN